MCTGSLHKQVTLMQVHDYITSILASNLNHYSHYYIPVETLSCCCDRVAPEDKGWIFSGPTAYRRKHLAYT